MVTCLNRTCLFCLVFKCCTCLLTRCLLSDAYCHLAVKISKIAFITAAQQKQGKYNYGRQNYFWQGAKFQRKGTFSMTFWLQFEPPRTPGVLLQKIYISLLFYHFQRKRLYTYAYIFKRKYIHTR